MAGGFGGVYQAKQEAQLMMAAQAAATEQEIALIHAKRSEKQDILENETNIQDTETEAFYGIKIWGKQFGIYIKTKSHDIVVNPAVWAKWSIAGLLVYTYTYVTVLFAGQPGVKANTLLPTPSEHTWEFLWFSSTTVTQYLAELSLQGISYMMCQPIIIMIFYILTKTSYRLAK